MENKDEGRLQAVLQTLSQYGTSTLTLDELRAQKDGFIIDMDGVIYYDKKLLPGIVEFITWLHESGKKYCFLTNGSERTPEGLVKKLNALGIQHVCKENFYTSAMATASFCAHQRPKGCAFVLGSDGLIEALRSVGYTVLDDSDKDIVPDYVIVGEGGESSYTVQNITKAVQLVRRGAILLGTNSDVADRVSGELVPACGSLTKPIEAASGKHAYYLGKPSPLMMFEALKRIGLGAHPERVCMIGDRLDTDVQIALWTNVTSIVVLTGVSTVGDLQQSPFKPDVVLPGIIFLAPPEVFLDNNNNNNKKTHTSDSSSSSSSSSSGNNNSNSNCSSGKSVTNAIEETLDIICDQNDNALTAQKNVSRTRLFSF